MCSEGTKEHLKSYTLLSRALRICSCWATESGRFNGSDDGGNVSKCCSSVGILLAKCRWCLEGRLTTAEVSVPRCVYRMGILLPLWVHVVNIVGVWALHEVVLSSEATHRLDVENRCLRRIRQAWTDSKQKTRLLHTLSWKHLDWVELCYFNNILAS